MNPAIDRELVVPDIEFNTVLRATSWQVDFGGKGFNVSRLLIGFDTPSIALGFVGGASGRMLEHGLQSLGIQTDFVWVNGETRTNVSIRSRESSQYIKANEPGPTITEKDFQALLAKTRARVEPGDWWVLAGSLPPGCPPAIYNQLIRIIQSRGGMAILDASGKSLSLGCEAGPYLCKPNLAEAEDLTGLSPASLVELAKAVHALGPSNVVISLGKDGAVYYGESGDFAANAPQIEEKNPIGAGDSMVGGMVWALDQGLDFQHVVRWGVACGAGTASLVGTSVAGKGDAEKMIGQIILE